jgi:hypothetical protein
MKTSPQTINQRLCAFCLFLTIAALGAAVSACKSGADGKPQVDYEKAQTAILATANAYATAKTSGNPSTAKQAAVAAGLASLNTEPAPAAPSVEAPVQ